MLKWVEFLQDYTFVLKYRPGVDNKVADAFSHVALVLQYMHTSDIGFDQLTDENQQCPDFGLIFKECLGNTGPTQRDFLIRDGYLFK